MKTLILPYNTGKTKIGYCDIGGKPQYYNALLFLQSFSRNTTGKIKITTKRHKGSIHFKDESRKDEYDPYYVPERKIGGFHGVIFDLPIKNKNIYVSVQPTKRIKK